MAELAPKKPVQIPVDEELHVAARPWVLGDVDAVSDVLHRSLYPPNTLEDVDEFVDVGAHVGSFTVLAFAMGASRGTALEPHPSNAEMLRKNVEENDITVDVIEAAAHRRRDVMEMFVAPSSVAHSVEMVRSREKIKVETVAIDDLNVSPDLIKVDAEGAEEHVLEGALETIQSHAPRLVISAYHYPGQEEDVARWLREEINYNAEIEVREASPYRSPALNVPVVIGEPRA